MTTTEKIHQVYREAHAKLEQNGTKRRKIIERLKCKHEMRGAPLFKKIALWLKTLS